MSTTPPENRHYMSAVSIVLTVRYITLATVCEDGSPWNTPLASRCDSSLVFEWGSASHNVHSKNIERDNRGFVTVYDTAAPEGMGEAMYLRGRVEKAGKEGEIYIYRFVPEQVWINDEAKNEDGTYKHDIRIPLDKETLVRFLKEKIAAL